MLKFGRLSSINAYIFKGLLGHKNSVPTHHSYLSNSNVENAWSLPYLSHTPSWHDA
jgi:hypothetical protein